MYLQKFPLPNSVTVTNMFFCRKFGRKRLLSKEFCVCFFLERNWDAPFKWGLSQLPKHYNPTTGWVTCLHACFESKALMICTCELLQEFPCGTCNAYRFTTILFCSSGIVLLGRTHGDIHIDLRATSPTEAITKHWERYLKWRNPHLVLAVWIRLMDTGVYPPPK